MAESKTKPGFCDSCFETLDRCPCSDNPLAREAVDGKFDEAVGRLKSRHLKIDRRTRLARDVRFLFIGAAIVLLILIFLRAWNMAPP